MASMRGLVRASRHGQAVHFQIHGCGRMTESLPFRRFAERCLQDGANCLRVDLRHCSYLDSTFLGTLLQLQRATRKHSASFVLVSPSDECSKLLHQIGVQDIFAVHMDEELICSNWLEVVASPEDPEAFNNNVLQAHEELASLGGASGDCFKRVANCLKADMKKKP